MSSFATTATAVQGIARKLVQCGIKAWLDIEQIRPGTTWQMALGEQIKNIKSAAVFVGNSGIGPWQSEEIQTFLGEFVDRKCPVIPTILASANGVPELPWTLKNRHRVDFRVSDPDPLPFRIDQQSRTTPQHLQVGFFLAEGAATGPGSRGPSKASRSHEFGFRLTAFFSDFRRNHQFKSPLRAQNISQ